MATAGVVLKDPFQNGRVPSEAQLKAYDRSYRQLYSEILAEDRQFSAKQTQKLKEALESLKDIKAKAQTTRKECEHKIQELRKQSEAIQRIITEYETRYKTTNREGELKQKINELEQQHLSNCKRRVEIAAGIDVKSFLKLDIDQRKSQANEVFKWIIVALYGQPENKYYWPNFKEQAIQEDKGADLVQRLGKIDALHAKEEQRVKTGKFLEQYEAVRKAPQLKKFDKQLQAIHQIAQLFYSSTEVGRKIKSLNKDIENSRAGFLKEDQERLHNTKNNNALLERIRVSQAYTAQLKAMEDLLANRVQRYRQEIAAGEAYGSELGKLNSYVSEYKAPVESGEKRDTCECAIY